MCRNCETEEFDLDEDDLAILAEITREWSIVDGDGLDAPDLEYYNGLLVPEEFEIEKEKK